MFVKHHYHRAHANESKNQKVKRKIITISKNKKTRSKSELLQYHMAFKNSRSHNNATEQHISSLSSTHSKQSPKKIAIPAFFHCRRRGRLHSIHFTFLFVSFFFYSSFFRTFARTEYANQKNKIIRATLVI